MFNDIYPVIIRVKKQEFCLHYCLTVSPLAFCAANQSSISEDGPGEFLSGIHETILLNKVNMNRTVRANIAKACLEMLLERLSQKCGKMKRYWLLRTNENTNIRP